MSKKMFDYVIGNPPYQEGSDDNKRQEPVYDKFMSEAIKVSDCVELITPARFLFNAGQTPKKWNEQMLNDEHFKVLNYEKDGSKIFSGTDIKGGVAITIRNENIEYGKIGVFTSEQILNDIVKRVHPYAEESSFSNFAHPKSQFGFDDVLYQENPYLKSRLTKGNEYIIDASIFDKMPEIFTKNNVNDNCVYIHGRKNNQRTGFFIQNKYIKKTKGINKYKVFVTGANGAGKFGESLSTPFVGKPNEVGTQTYMSFGFFDTEEEALNCLHYIQCKFTRALLSVLKVTQNNPRAVWYFIPSQDFTSDSDIDWSKSIHEIDLQLYKKYGLEDKEIEFIESHVKEME